jgi:hypothetical protein
MTESPEPHPRDADRLIYAGLLGLSAAAVIQLSEKSDLNLALTVEVTAFAVALPLLAVGLVTDYARRAGTFIPPWRDLIGILGSLAAIVGLGALFFNFGIAPGAVFAALCFIGFVLVRML